MAHRSRLAGFIIDCEGDGLDAAADFWAAALGMSVADRDAGSTPGTYEQFGDTPAGLHVEVQKVAHAPRVHLDIETDDIEAEVARLAALGAHEVSRPHDGRWVVMQAPTGHRFCVVRMHEGGNAARANRWA
jgi:predicted enzyme related to lactoylglutathione lyase